MGNYAFKLPDIGEGIAEAEIVKWHVNVGDAVVEGQTLADIMTDKATVEVAAPVTGIIRARRGSEGSKLAIGAELAVIETAEADTPASLRTPEVADKRTPRQETPAASHSKGKVLASPAVRARAKSLGIDLASIVGRGSGGRVEHADLDTLLAGAQKPVQPTPALAPPEEGAEDIKIFGLRRRIAERMLDSKRRVPHFSYVEEVDVTALEELRATLNAADSQRPRVTVLPFLIRAIVLAVAQHPAINCHFHDAQDLIRKFAAVHAGIATQTERGLLVPVIRNAQAMDIWSLAAEIARLSAAARAGKSDRADLVGSTITVTSLGALGGIMATPIINPPEVAIVGVNKIADRAAVRDGRIVVRKMMNLSSSFDHRIVDGHQAAAFIAGVKELMEAPQQLASGDVKKH